MFESGQIEPETTANPLLAFGPDDSAVGFYQPAGNCEAQAGAAGGAVTGRVRPVQSVKYTRQFFRRNARPGVGHFHTSAVAMGQSRNGNEAARRSMANRIVQEIAKRLLNTKPIQLYSAR